jgi:16S rRNA (adenine1518-N6/adenine1519-N6)-dimethyltransferase
MKLSEMRDVLERQGIQLTKSLGQNFLHDANQLKRIVDAAELTRQDKILEIGPGLGPLTELLLERAGEVLAIELDARLVEFLANRFGLESQEQTPALTPSLSLEERESDLDALVNPPLSDSSQRGNNDLPLPGKRAGVRADSSATAKISSDNLFLIHDDALALLKREQRDWSEWKLVANLPYSVASPILVELASGRRSPQRIVATLQLEVAKRLMAQADDDDYGILTLLVQLDFEPRGWFKIPSDCFFPEPGVDSGCVTLIRRAEPLLSEELRPAFYKIVKRAFSQRRKMMMKLLKQDWAVDKLAAAFAELKISPQERAEKLSLEQFVALTKILAKDA